MTKSRLLLLILLVFGAFSLFADGDCKVCDYLEFTLGEETQVSIFCRNANDNEYGSTRCEVTWTQLMNGGYAQCRYLGEFCSVMVVEVNP